MAVALFATAVFFVWQAALLPFGGMACRVPASSRSCSASCLAVLALAILYRSIARRARARSSFSAIATC